MKLSVKGDTLEVSINGDMDFATCCQLLSSCKEYLKSNPKSKMMISLDDVLALETCAIATLSLIADWMPGRLHVNLRQCGTQISRIFDHSVFDVYFSKNKPFVTSYCYSCLEKQEPSAAQTCQHNNLLVLSNNDQAS